MGPRSVAVVAAAWESLWAQWQHGRPILTPSDSAGSEVRWRNEEYHANLGRQRPRGEFGHARMRGQMHHLQIGTSTQPSSPDTHNNQIGMQYDGGTDGTVSNPGKMGSGMAD